MTYIMVYPGQLTPIYFNEVSPRCNELSRKVREFENYSPLNIDQLFSKKIELQQIFERASEAINHAKEEMRRLENTPLSNREQIRIAQLNGTFPPYLKMRARIDKVFYGFLGEFRAAKDGKRTSLQVLHPRALFYAEPLSNALQIISENSISSFPIGIGNGSNNCWADALLQFIINIPGLSNNLLLRLPNEYQALQEFASTYLRDRHDNETTPGSKPITDAQSQTFRTLLSSLFHEIISPSSEESEDADEAFSCLFNHISHPESNPLFTEVTTIRQYDIPREHPLHNRLGTALCPDLDIQGRSYCRNHEFKIFIDLQNYSHLPFQELMDKSFRNTQSEEATYSGYTVALKEELRIFSHLPRHLLFSLKRFEFTQYGAEKIDANIPLPEQYVLPSQYVGSNQNGLYQLKGFIRHHGIYQGGHYVTYIRMDTGKWVLINDESTRIISPQELRAALNQAYIPYYELVEEVSSQQALQITEEYPSALPQTSSSPLNVSFEEKLLEKQKLDTFAENPTIENFNALPEPVRNSLCKLKWLEDGYPADIENYGEMKVWEDPTCLLGITRPWLITEELNIIGQYAEKAQIEAFILFLKNDQKIFAQISSLSTAIDSQIKETFIQNLSPLTKEKLREKIGNKQPVAIFDILLTNRYPFFTSRSNLRLVDQLSSFTEQNRSTYTNFLVYNQLVGFSELLESNVLTNFQLDFPLEELKKLDPFSYQALLDATGNTEQYLRSHIQEELGDPFSPAWIHPEGGALIDQLARKKL